MASNCMLSTVDNEFDPFEDFVHWFLYDVEKGYNCCSRVARVANLTEDMSTEEAFVENERAIDEIIANDFLGIYKKVTKTAESN